MQTIGQVEKSDADSFGEFSEGDPLKGIVATRLCAQWLNSQQQELINLAQGFGGKLDPNDDAQISQLLGALTPLRHQNAIPHHHRLAGFSHYPHIESQSERLDVIKRNAWNIEINNAQIFYWRGVWSIATDAFSTLERSFELVANNVYHLRWRPLDGFLLLSLRDTSYNPKSLDQADPIFDTTFDDMLIARITTDDQGITEVVTLRNTQRLLRQWLSKQPSRIETRSTGSTFSDTTPVASLSLQWARTPRAYWQGVSGLNLGSQYRATSDLLRPLNRWRFGVRTTREQALLYDRYERGQADQPTWHYVLCA